MTVSQLIDALSRHPENEEVIVAVDDEHDLVVGDIKSVYVTYLDGVVIRAARVER